MRAFFLILAVLTLSACSAIGNRNAPPPVSAAALHVREQRPITIDGARILSLSPDGKWLAAEKQDAMCVYATATLAEQHCATLADARIDLPGIAWSPDSTRIALTEDVYGYLEESDVWIFDVATGALTNLTDDGATGNGLRRTPAESQPYFDMRPAWSPDGKTLLFARTPPGRDQSAIYRISASGGAAEQVLTVKEDVPYALDSVRWTIDGQRMVYTIAIPGSQAANSDNGVWIADTNGQNARQLVATEQERGPVRLEAVAASTDKALILYPQVASGFGATDANVSPYALVDLSTGAVEALKPAEGGASEVTRVLNAVLSPDGSKILYAYQDKAETFRVVVRDVEGGAEQELLSDPEQALGFALLHEAGLDWADNDIIFVSTGADSGLLLQLAAR
jgi:Tol biopolymer transport system component